LTRTSSGWNRFSSIVSAISAGSAAVAADGATTAASVVAARNGAWDRILRIRAPAEIRYT